MNWNKAFYAILLAAGFGAAEARAQNGLTDIPDVSIDAAIAGFKLPEGAKINLFAGDPDMAGNYFGYDGPCPPWNDSLIHHYVFTLFAVDVASCNVSGDFTGHDVRQALEGHILGQSSILGTYTLNPRLR